VSLSGLTAGQLAGLGLTASQYAGLQGLAIFQAQNATATLSLSGQGNVNITGTIYAATATIDVTGNGSLNLTGSATKKLGAHLIAADLTVTGNGGVNVDTSDNNLELL
jgi:isocitrate/isopropylmalate dehydrogenase